MNSRQIDRIWTRYYGMTAAQRRAEAAELRDQLAEATRADNLGAIERIDFRLDILEAVEGD